MSGSEPSRDVGYLSLGNAFLALLQQALIPLGPQLGKLLAILRRLLVLDELESWTTQPKPFESIRLAPHCTDETSGTVSEQLSFTVGPSTVKV
jgi:hypothetical protein